MGAFETGYNIATGASRKKIQESAIKLESAQAGSYEATANKTEQEVKALKEQNSLLQMQTHMIQNQIAAKDLEQATDELVTNGNYEHFNKIIKTNSTIAAKMKNNYGVSAIRPIDWNSKMDIAELKKQGFTEDDIAKLDDDSKAGISQAFYMTDAGHITSLDDFVQHTGYLNRATSDKLNAYTQMKDKLANIGKHLSTDQVEAQSANTWLEAHPDRTYNDWKNVAIQNKTKATIEINKSKPTAAGSARRDTLKQLREAAAADLGYNYWSEVPADKKLEVSHSINTRMQGGTSQVREDKDVKDIVTSSDIGKKLNSGDNSISSSVREKAEAAFIHTDKYKTYKKAKLAFDSEYNNYKFTNELNNKLQVAIKSGDYKTGFIDTLKTTVAKYSSTELRGFMGMDEVKIAKKLGLEGSLGRSIAGVLKEMSGTAASDSEFGRTLSYTLGSQYYDEKSQSVLMNNTVNDLKTKLINNGRTLRGVGFVGSVHDKLTKLEGVKQTMIKQGIIVNGYTYIGNGTSNKSTDWEKIK